MDGYDFSSNKTDVCCVFLCVVCCVLCVVCTILKLKKSEGVCPPTVPKYQKPRSVYVDRSFRRP